MVDETNLESFQISNDYQLTIPQEIAASMLAIGHTRQEVATAVGVGVATIYRWQNDPEFRAEMDRLTYLTGLTVKAERLRAIKQVIRSKMNDDEVLQSDKDVLDWIKLLKDEVGSIELGAFLAASLKEKFGL